MFSDGSAVAGVKPVAVGASHWLVLHHEAEHVVRVEFKRSTSFGGRFEKHLGVVYADLLDNVGEVILDV